MVCNGGPSEKVLYRICRKLSSLIENCIMEGVRSPSPYCYLKNIIFLICYQTLFSYFISDMGVLALFYTQRQTELGKKLSKC